MSSSNQVDVTAEVSGDIIAGGIYDCEYDGTNFQIISITGNVPTVTPATPTLSQVLTAGNDGGGLEIKNILDPTTNQSADTKAARDAAIATAIAGVNPAVAVKCATTAASDTSGLTYTHVAGVGDFFTGTINTPISFDGVAFTVVGQRGLVKDDTQAPSGAFNGVYYLSQLQTLLLPAILVRALDYDTPSDINNTGTIPVISGTVNGGTSWLLTTTVTTVGTDPLTYTQFTPPFSTIVKKIVGGTNNDIVTQDAGGGIQDSGKAFDTDGTLAANSDNKIATQKAVKTYSDTKLAIANNLSDVNNAAPEYDLLIWIVFLLLML